MTKEGGGKVLFWLAVLPAETGRAARSTVVNGRPATKGKETCEKFRQMKTHSMFLSGSHPPALLLGMSAMVWQRGRRRE